MITSIELDAWFVPTRRDAQELLPHLIRRLVLGTTSIGSVTDFRIPVGDEIGRPGYDGKLTLIGTHLCIPSGTSVWEAGVGDPGTKANKEYRKRTEKPGDIVPAETTFMFVTPHTWPGRDKWVKARRAEGIWKDVRVLDDSDFATWLEVSPPTGRWLAREMGIPVEQLRDQDQFWNELNALYGIEISPALAISGRQSAVDAIHKWLDSGATSLTVEGESLEEAMAFIAAALAAIPEPKRSQYESRLLFVDGPAGVEAISFGPSGVLAIPTTDEARVKLKSIRLPTVRSLLPRGKRPGQPAGGDAVRLGQMRRAACEQAIRDLRLSTQAANRIALESKGSFGATLWMLARDLERPPKWTQSNPGRDLVPLMLAGQWIAEQAGDREVVAKLAGRTYEEVERIIAACSGLDGPLIRRGVTWDWRGVEYAWQSLAIYFDVDQLNRFIETAKHVLTSPDPKLDLDPDQRWAAPIYGKTHPYSVFLRAGLVESIVHLATSPVQLGGRDGQVIADLLVGDVFGTDASTVLQRFQILANFLPDLAEASPNCFLNAVELLSSAEPARNMFVEGGLMSWSPHIYLLWALERLAWSADYFTRVILSLGRLAILDPGGNSRNRPSNSLTELLLPWHPQTTATVEHRLSAIDRLHSRFAEVAWQLCVSLMPDGVQFVASLAQPQWRAWKPDDLQTPTGKDYWEFIEQIVRRMLQWVDNVGSRWISLARAYTILAVRADEIAERVLTAIETLDPQRLSPEDRLILAESLRDLAARHREFASAEWALSNDKVVRVELVYQRVKSVDPADQNIWLFKGWPTLPEERSLSFEQHQLRLQELRQTALRAIWQSGGMKALYRFVERVEAPGTLGESLAELDIDEQNETLLLNDTLSIVPEPSDIPKRFNMGLGYVFRRYAIKGPDWLTNICNRPDLHWDANRYANLAWGLPAASSTWDFIASRGADAETLYWQRTPISYLHQGGADLARAVHQLLHAGRPRRVIFLVGLSLGRQKPGEPKGPEIPVEPELVVQALRDVLEANPSTEWFAPAINSLIHSVGQLLDGLEADGLDQKTLIELEWRWLSALEHTERGTKALQRALCDSPDFFVEILCLVFKGEGESGERTKVDESKKTAAMQAYRLLERWHEVPGLLLPTKTERKPEDRNPAVAVGAVDRDRLLAWIKSAREIAAQKSRLKICDSRIGNVLAYSPADPDGLWPCEGVRDVIELMHNDDIHRGLFVGLLNKRGAHFRRAGGNQERMLRDQYGSFSERAKARWPLTTTILKSIADYYDREAKREDEAAELEEFE